MFRNFGITSHKPKKHILLCSVSTLTETQFFVHIGLQQIKLKHVLFSETKISLLYNNFVIIKTTIFVANSLLSLLRLAFWRQSLILYFAGNDK